MQSVESHGRGLQLRVRDSKGENETKIKQAGCIKL